MPEGYYPISQYLGYQDIQVRRIQLKLSHYKPSYLGFYFNRKSTYSTAKWQKIKPKICSHTSEIHFSLICFAIYIPTTAKFPK